MPGLRPIDLLKCLSALALLQLVACSTDDVTGGGTNTGNATVTAMLRNPGGTPAVGARIWFVPVGDSPRPQLNKVLAAVDSTIADSDGNYEVLLDSGVYNMLAEGDSGVAYRDSILVPWQAVVRPPDDTLTAAGSIRGVVRLQPGDDSRTVFILFMGTRTWVTPVDSIGNFYVPNLAQGTYRVTIITTLSNYAAMDTVLCVVAGRDSVLPDTLRPAFTGIAAPSGLVLSYDQSMQIVSLIWEQSDTSLVSGYNVYRRNVDSGFVRLNGAPLSDTTYTDSTAQQDQNYTYQIKAVDKSGDEGPFSLGVSVIVSAAYVLSGETDFSATIDGVHRAVVRDDGTILIICGVGSRTPGLFVGDTAGQILRPFQTSTLGRPEDVGIDRTGTVYVTDYADSSLKVFSAQGDSLGKWKLDGPPTTVGVGDSLVHIVVNSRTVLSYALSGVLVRTMTLQENVYALDEGPVGELFVLVETALIRVSPDGTSVASLRDADPSMLTTYNANRGLTVVDSTSLAYLFNMVIYAVDLEGHSLSKLCLPVETIPLGIQVTGHTETIWVADGRGRILTYSPR